MTGRSGRLPVGGRVRLVVVVGGTRHPHELQERGEWVFPPQRLHYLVLPPVAERSVAEAAIRFKISTSISRRRTAARGPPRSRAPSSFAPMDGRRGRPRLPLGTASPSPRICAWLRTPWLEGEGFVVALATEIGSYDTKLELLGVAVVLPRPVYSLDAALVDPLPPKLHG